MRFAIPVADGKLALHFGHSKEFIFIDVEDGVFKKTQTLEPPPHEPGVLPKWMHDNNVNVIIAGGMGHKAREFFIGFGIEVVIGAPQIAAEELVSGYLNKTLVSGPNACDH